MKQSDVKIETIAERLAHSVNNTSRPPTPPRVERNVIASTKKETSPVTLRYVMFEVDLTSTSDRYATLTVMFKVDAISIKQWLKYEFDLKSIGNYSIAMARTDFRVMRVVAINMGNGFGAWCIVF